MNLIRRHLVSGTMEEGFGTEAEKVLCHVSALTSEAKYDIAMQEGLTSEDVFFLTSCIEASTNKVTVREKKFAAPRGDSKRHVFMTRSFSTWFNAVGCACMEGRLCFITCSQKNVASSLYASITTYCCPTGVDQKTWMLGVALVTGTVTAPTTKLQSASDFVRSYKDFRVAIATSTLESGVSFTGHYELDFA